MKILKKLDLRQQLADTSGDIVVSNVQLTYGERDKKLTALDGLSLSVMPQEFCAIVGPSGCGKSSLLYLIAGLQERSGGAISVNGIDVDGPGPDRGMVFQTYTLFPWMTVADNIAFGPRHRGVPKSDCDAIVDDYLREVGLEGFGARYPAELSGGMKQRVAIARALANDPAVLLMDEPFGALDSQTRFSMQRLLLRVWEHRRKTVLFVTHDIEEALLLADRVVVMSGRPGRIIREIDVRFARPRTGKIVLDPEFLALKHEILMLLDH